VTESPAERNPLQNSSSPGDSCWEFAVRLYGTPGIEPACLELQDEAGTDVLLILLACWLGATCRGIDGPTARTLLSVAGRWRHDVVSPLRQSRRALGARIKAGELAELPAAALRAALARVEVDAERLALAELARLASEAKAVQEASLEKGIHANLGALGVFAPQHEGALGRIASAAARLQG
jgi:uncharacterized protein (TIGR02444 family)